MFKKNTIILILISFFLVFKISAQSYTSYNYYYSLFNSNYKKSFKTLSSLKDKSYKKVVTKQLHADFYYVMYESTGDLEAYNTLCKKEAYYVNKTLSAKDKLTDDEVATIISAKSIILKIQFKKKNYLKVAKEFQSIIKYLKYALKHDDKPKLKLVAGMYNYYVELAKEDYPALYPILIFFPSGNKQKGLRILKECTKINDIYVQTRASLFLAGIYSSDEKDFTQSKYWFTKLLKKYPNNLIWRRNYILTLRKYKKIDVAKKEKVILLSKIKNNPQIYKRQIKYFKGL